MKDQGLENTIKVIKVVAITIIVSLVATVIYHGVIMGEFTNSINF